MVGCFLICAYSSSVSLASFNKTLSGTPIFPISWKRPPTLKIFICSSGRSNVLPIRTEYSDTRSE